MKQVIKQHKIYSGIMCMSLFFMLLFLIGGYIFLVNRTVWNIAARQSYQSKTSDLSSDIGQLESTYMSAKQAININQAHLMGFREVASKNTEFVQRTKLGQANFIPIE